MVNVNKLFLYVLSGSVKPLLFLGCTDSDWDIFSGVIYIYFIHYTIFIHRFDSFVPSYIHWTEFSLRISISISSVSQLPANSTIAFVGTNASGCDFFNKVSIVTEANELRLKSQCFFVLAL